MGQPLRQHTGSPWLSDLFVFAATSCCLRQYRIASGTALNDLIIGWARMHIRAERSEQEVLVKRISCFIQRSTTCVE
ncbi:hypothetical protein Pan241w_10600 [Gimesia alba]|uniref:Uncharacterized protein n=1 Tax=Gimesia alba TaxID=2527973 RepID=A0A517RAV5_9PLAN|nr:hypothetical protein Pan241w_10600 [Gimesia alba]